MIFVNLWLHGKPNWALPIEGKTELEPFVIKEYADRLREHLYLISFMITKLQNNGWKLIESYGTLYSLEYYKEGIDKLGAKIELRSLGIDLETIHMEEIDRLEELEEEYYHGL